MENKKEDKKDERLCEFENLHRIFRYLNGQIRHYRSSVAEETKEGLIEKRDKMLWVAKEIDFCDLEILYYIRKIDGLGKMKMRQMLKEYYEAQCRFKEDLKKL